MVKTEELKKPRDVWLFQASKIAFNNFDQKNDFKKSKMAKKSSESPQYLYRKLLMSPVIRMIPIIKVIIR